MRIADKMTYEQVRNNIGKNRSTMQDLQNQAATQKRVMKPSDDPLAASRVLANRIDLQDNRQFSKSVNYAKSFLEYTDQSLSDVSEIMMRVKELAISQSNDASANEETRRVVATEIEQLYNQLVNIGNRKLGDRFIFGGYVTQSAPFDPKGHYQGDEGEMMIHIDKESYVAMNIPGARVFLGSGLAPGGGVKATERQPRTIEELQNKEAEVRGPASGPMNPEISTTDSNLISEGQVISSEETPLKPGGINIFNTLRNFEIALRANDKEGVHNILNDLDTALEQTVLTRAQVGSRAAIVENYMQTLEKAKVENQASISNLEDADIYSTISDINKTESALQATLQTSGKIIESSLLQFLR